MVKELHRGGEFKRWHSQMTNWFKGMFRARDYDELAEARQRLVYAEDTIARLGESGALLHMKGIGLRIALRAFVEAAEQHREPTEQDFGYARGLLEER